MYSYSYVSTDITKQNYDLTSQVPIFKTVAGKFEALSLESAVAAAEALWSFFLESCCCESLIWIKSKREGLFFRRKPRGLGSSKGLYKDGEIGSESSLESHCPKTKTQNLELEQTILNYPQIN